MRVHLIWDDGALTIAPLTRAIKEALTYTEKSFGAPDPTRPWERRTIYRKVHLYKDVGRDNAGHQAVQTFQGLWQHVKEASEAAGDTVELHDKRLPFPEPKLGNMGGFRFNQKQLLTSALAKDCSGLVGAPTRYGKCVHENTDILMGDGITRKEAKDIVIGDYVMGSDSLPKRVENVTQGTDEMYRITPKKGESWICTQDHILVLQCNCSGQYSGINKGDKIHVRLDEYLTWPKSKKHIFKQVQAKLDKLSGRDVPFDPYILGSFIGDGHTSGPYITLGVEKKKAVADYVKSWAEDYSETINKNTYLIRIKSNYEFSRYWESVIANSRTIPKEYLANSVDIRMQLLAGLLDTDGSVNNGKSLEFTTKYEGLRDSFLHLCRSLGFRCNYTSKWVQLDDWEEPREYFRFQISGNIDEIPFKTPRFTEEISMSPRHKRGNPLTTGFKVEHLGVDKYCGMQIEGDTQEFVLGNFTITHNTYLMLNTLKAYPGIPSILTAPGTDLVKQLYKDVKEHMPGRDVKLIGAGSRVKYQGDDITVASIDSMHKCEPSKTRLILIDEPHMAVTNSRLPILHSFHKARKLGFGATLKERYDNRELVIKGLMGPVLSERTFPEAVAEGAVAPLRVFMLRVPLEIQNWGDHTKTYKALLHQNECMARLVSEISSGILPEDWQSIMFIKNEDQAEYYKKFVGEQGTIVMAKRMTAKERDATTERMKQADIKRCLATEIYSTGITFNHVRAVFNLCGGGPYASTIQKPGRVVEVRPNKKCGVLFDFLFVPDGGAGRDGRGGVWSMIRESNQRKNCYEEKGYDITIVDTLSELEDRFRVHCV